MLTGRLAVTPSLVDPQEWDAIRAVVAKARALAVWAGGPVAPVQVVEAMHALEHLDRVSRALYVEPV